MPSEEKLEKVIVQIIRQTTEGKIEWKAASAPRSLTAGTGDVVEAYYETNYKGQTIAIFERRYQDYFAEDDGIYWTSKDCLAFLGDDGSISWETSDHPSHLSTLLKVAKESAADVDGILDKLLQ